jgi:hypothetical protein
MPAVPWSDAARRPASTTEYPAFCSATLTARPIPLPAPVTIAIFPCMPPILAQQVPGKDLCVIGFHRLSSFANSVVSVDC